MSAIRPPLAVPRSMFKAVLLSFVTLLVIAVPSWAQSGLLGEYFDNANLTSLVETRIDDSVDFTTWGTKPTGTGVAPDGVYSQRWTGFVRIETPGTWTFTTNSNDGVRLWVDDELIIDEWTQHAAQVDSGSLAIGPGWYPIRLEHFQQGGAVVIQLSFQGPGQSKIIIPSTHLGLTVSGSLPPKVDLGVDKMVVQPSQKLTMAADVVDADSTQLTYAWSQVAGPPAQFLDADEPTATAYGMTGQATYTFRLTVTDEAGASSSDDVNVTVIDSGTPGGVVTGTTKMYHRASVNFVGANTSENASPNPFVDRRLNVLFIHLPTGTPMVVPGFYAADGQASETSATSGNIWRAHVTPGLEGLWFYKASFRAGTQVAISLEPDAGAPTQFDGESGTFVVGPADPDAPGFLTEGHLQYDGSHYLKFSGSGRTYIKGGANSPENLLAYTNFDQTVGSHAYNPHVSDWKPGDPVWKGNKGKGLIGGLNYLAEMGVNSVYFLTFNVAGDGKDVWPWTNQNQRERFDVSKLDQWEVVFDHMDKRGLMLHVVTQETENDTGVSALDGGNLGLERKLYYRELIARFGHHLAVTWNLGEENTNELDEQLDFYDYFVALDAYQHPVVLHTFPSSMNQVYGPLLAQGALEGASLQLGAVKDTHERTLFWRDESAASGEPWIVSLDEIGPASSGVRPDADDPDHDAPRIEGLWGNLMAGGGGAEWYFGYNYPHDDLDCEDWRSRHNMWNQTRYALEFFGGTAFERLVPNDSLITGPNWCTAEPGKEYVGFLKDGGTASITIDAGTYDVTWFDPRNGGSSQTGSITTVTGPGSVSIGFPPASTGDDWAVHVVRQTNAPVITNAAVIPNVYSSGPLGFYVQATDAEGIGDIVQVNLSFFSPVGTPVGNVDAPLLPNGQAWGIKFPSVTGIPLGTWTMVAEVTDASGKTDSTAATFRVE